MNARIKQLGMGAGLALVFAAGVVGTMGQYVPPTGTSTVSSAALATGGGLAVTGGKLGLSTSCAAGERLEFDGSAWGCRVTLPRWDSGSYVFLPNATNTSSSATLGVGTLRLVPFYVPNPVTLDRIGTEITVIGDAGSKVRLCTYATGTDGRPSTLVADEGQVAGDSVAMPELTVSVSLASGWYWQGAVVQSVVTTQPTLRTAASGAGGVMPIRYLAKPTAGQVAAGYIATGITGACPSTITVTDVHNSYARVFARVL